MSRAALGMLSRLRTLCAPEMWLNFTAQPRLAWMWIGNVLWLLSEGVMGREHQHWGHWSSLGSRRGPLGSAQGQSEEKKLKQHLRGTGQNTPGVGGGCNPCGVMFGKYMDVISMFWEGHGCDLHVLVAVSGTGSS